MGVPAFFRWLSKKYPSIVSNTNEVKPQEINGVTVPVDATLPNPNGVEFDNFYLDMNGIIHPCCHPENKPAPKNEDEMMANIFDYIDRLFRIVRPRRLLYMAIDGVAPRAKMNQQRSRRFRASKEAQEKREQIQAVRAELEAQLVPLPPERRADEYFDSNCITPGTPFMARLSDCLQYYIHERLNTDPAWKNLIVILSDASAPGEGEHKIMDYIRKQRASPDHDPNTQHVLCGADADLIMLGLATHEPNFTIIREEFVPNTQRPCELCHQYGHELKECQGLSAIQSGEYGEVAKMSQRDTNFIFIRLSVLREYLARDMALPNLPFEFNLERVIDDWVFMCFFVGNDFLPHLPSLEIRENAIDRLINLYKDSLYKSDGYLTDSGFVSLARVQMILSELGEVEDQIFQTRQHSEMARRRRDKERRNRMKAYSAPNLSAEKFSNRTVAPGRQESVHMTAKEVRTLSYESRMANFANESAARTLKNQLKGGASIEDVAAEPDRNSVKRKREDEDSEDEDANDEVKLWQAGWKERYYQSKFEVSEDDTTFRYSVSAAYAVGLCWVLRYYYQGVPDWSWFYPYHYAPFASDFINIGDIKLTFDQESEPVTPLVQLMSVFPAASRQHLPDAWSNLMTDIKSPIIDFYPDDFRIDLNGKKFAWQGVALLPFVDKDRLDETLVEVEHLLSDEEKQRNTRGENKFFVSQHHSVFEFLTGAYEGEADEEDDEDNKWIQIDSKLTLGVGGLISKCDDHVPIGGSMISVLAGLPNIDNNRALVVSYKDPQYPLGFKHSSARLPNAVDPEPTLRPQDWDNRRPYQPMIGFSRDGPRAYLDPAGGRMLNHAMGRNRFDSRRDGYDRYAGQMAGGGPEHGPSRYGQRYEPYSNHGNASHRNDFWQNSSAPQQQYPNQSASWQMLAARQPAYNENQGWQQQQRHGGERQNYSRDPHEHWGQRPPNRGFDQPPYQQNRPHQQARHGYHN